VFLDSVGIILKRNDVSPYKLIILDKLQGKIECIAAHNNLSAGALITYNIQHKGHTIFISDSTLIYVPLSLARTDMLFFHHVIELIYYFTPVGSCSKEVFDLLAFLYSTEQRIITQQYKKFFLLKLLSRLGSFPEISEIRTSFVTKLNSVSIQQLSTTTITASEEKELDRWLWCCVWQHPYVNEFKTVHFLAENRTL
jgi:hypothetical protein